MGQSTQAVRARCGYSPCGLGRSGRCPECGGRFDLTRRARVERTRSVREWWMRLAPAWMPVAIVVLVLGAWGVLVWVGWQAYERTARLMAWR
jgi:hypothetical protein